LVCVEAKLFVIISRETLTQTSGMIHNGCHSIKPEPIELKVLEPHHEVGLNSKNHMV
jgi:hypothetical protein